MSGALCVVEVANGRAEKAWWFPEGKADPRAETRRVKAICAECPIRDECLADAMRVETGHGRESRHGIFGGLTPSERYALADGRTRTCEICERPFVADRARKTCGLRCEQIRAARYMRDYQRTYRNNGKPNPIKKHGSIACYVDGCRSAVCRGAARTAKREQRLRQRIAQDRMQDNDSGEAA